VADRDEVDRPPFGRRAGRLDADEAGELRAERLRPRPELRERQELAMGGDAGEQRVEIDRDGYDSSFDE